MSAAFEKYGRVTRSMADKWASKPLTDAEADALQFVGLGPAGQPRLTIDQQSFDLCNDGYPWGRNRAEWYCTMLAVAIARMLSRAPVSAPEAVTVKPLVWERFTEDGEDCWIADGMGVTYEAGVDVSGQPYWKHHRRGGGHGADVDGGAEAAKAAAQTDYEARIRAALQPGDGWQGIESAPLDRSQLIVAVPDQHRAGWIVGEAYYDPEAKDWFWAGTGAHGIDCGPISEANHWLPELWRPMPEPSNPPAPADRVRSLIGGA